MKELVYKKDYLVCAERTIQSVEQSVSETLVVIIGLIKHIVHRYIWALSARFA